VDEPTWYAGLAFRAVVGGDIHEGIGDRGGRGGREYGGFKCVHGLNVRHDRKVASRRIHLICDRSH
jgi:hypothetical protein